MKKLLAVFIVLFAAASAHAADDALLSKAKAEGKVAFYANITAVEPIMKAFSADTGVQGGVHPDLDHQIRGHDPHRIRRPASSWPTSSRRPLPVLEMLKEKGVLASYRSPAAAGYPEWTQQGRHASSVSASSTSP